MQRTTISILVRIPDKSHKAYAIVRRRSMRMRHDASVNGRKSKMWKKANPTTRIDKEWHDVLVHRDFPLKSWSVHYVDEHFDKVNVVMVIEYFDKDAGRIF